MRYQELIESASNADKIEKIKSLGVMDQYEYARSMSDDELQSLVDSFDDSFEMWKVAFTTVLNDRQRELYDKEHSYKKVNVDPSKIWYRGTQQESYGAKPRDGYATFVTDNVWQAASYAGPDGVITSMKLSPSVAYAYKHPFRPGSNKPSTGEISFVEFDEQVMKTHSGTAIVAQDVVDNGYYRQQLSEPAKSSYAATNIGFKDDSIATIVDTIPASKYFKKDAK